MSSVDAKMKRVSELPFIQRFDARLLGTGLIALGAIFIVVGALHGHPLVLSVASGLRDIVLGLGVILASIIWSGRRLVVVLLGVSALLALSVFASAWFAHELNNWSLVHFALCVFLAAAGLRRIP